MCNSICGLSILISLVMWFFYHCRRYLSGYHVGHLLTSIDTLLISDMERVLLVFTKHHRHLLHSKPSTLGQDPWCMPSLSSTNVLDPWMSCYPISVSLCPSINKCTNNYAKRTIYITSAHHQNQNILTSVSKFKTIWKPVLGYVDLAHTFLQWKQIVGWRIW